jgi:histidinol dehydrogenase
MKILQIATSDADFAARINALTHWQQPETEAIETTVGDIVAEVRTNGDAALLNYTNQFDRRALNSPAEFCLDADQLASAWASVGPEARAALDAAAARIKAFHQHQVERSWSYQEDDGTVLGQQITPLERAGLYVPGGRAAYPSSLLMNAIPAKVAGVEEVVVAVPAPDNHLQPMVLAAAHVANVDRVFTIGGAQAIAALAYGTDTVPAVDKIVGPGNIYVATAKRMVFGICGIDMVAGPSEILIISDGTVEPHWLALDLLAQAEHDELARAILISPDAEHLQAVKQAVLEITPTLERADIAAVAIADRGALILARDLGEAVDVANGIAPEHLQLAVAAPRALLSRVRHAGAIFLGGHSPEAFGDYCAGPNHVLPTARTARFSSPLGVYDFQKRSSIIECSPGAAARLAPTASVLARAEGLTAHARSAEARLGNHPLPGTD